MSAANNARGFSLLEAIVAMALLGLAASALLAWLDSTLISASRVRAVNSEAMLILDALPIVEHVNPMQNPEGSFAIPPLSVRWKSKQLGDLRDSAVPLEATGVFKVGLYEVDVVAKGAHEEEAHFTLRRVGWVRR